MNPRVLELKILLLDLTRLKVIAAYAKGRKASSFYLTVWASSYGWKSKADTLNLNFRRPIIGPFITFLFRLGNIMD